MKNLYDDFLKYQARTTANPLGIVVERAQGSYIYDSSGKKFLDFIAGVSACSLGHCHPKVVEAIKTQVDRYMHVMVYGEFAQKPAVELSRELVNELPDNLKVLYLVNSGAEAIEGAVKLAKRVTGRNELIAAHNAYHGSTHGALSLLGIEQQKKAYRPLLPGIQFIRFNKPEDLQKITRKTAAVILEVMQGAAGFILPEDNYLYKVKKRCKEVGALLILDEIQSGFGRTGELFGFKHFNVIPDILVIGKGMGGGLPIGAFISSRNFMNKLSENPQLGHITTFGGNSVIAAAALATLRTIKSERLMEAVNEKEQLFRTLLRHQKIKQINGMGLALALIFENEKTASEVILKSMDSGLILFWLLWDKKAVRISPPLTISIEEIKKGCTIILGVLDRIKVN